MNGKTAILWVLAAGLCGCDFGIPGSGVAATETRELESFDRVTFAGWGSAYITIGEPQSVVITADDNLLPIIETWIRDGALIIEPSQSISPKVQVVARITVPELNGVKLAGSTKTEVRGVVSQSFDLDISGQGSATVTGRTDRLSATISGDGLISATDLQATEASIRITGSGDIAVHTTDDLDITVMGSGTVRYAGDPKVTRNVLGDATIERIR